MLHPHLTVKFSNDSMVTIDTTRDIRSRYSKHVYHGVSKRDREPSRMPVRTLKCLAKKSRKLKEFVYDRIRSKMHGYVKVRKLQKCDTMKAKKNRVLKQRKKHILLKCSRSFYPGMMKLKYRATKYLSLFSCNRPMCLYKNQTHLANYYQFKLSSDIEKNPGPMGLDIDHSKTIRAPCSQSNEILFGQNAGQQCVALSLCSLVYKL